MNKNFRKQNKKNILNCNFLVSENVVFLTFAVISTILIIISFGFKNNDIKDMIQTLFAGIFVAVLVPLFINLSMFMQEKRSIGKNCESIIAISIILVGNLNEYLISRGGQSLIAFLKPESDKVIDTLNLNGIRVASDLFALIKQNWVDIRKSKYLIVNNVVEMKINEISISVDNACRLNNYNQLYKDLRVMLNLLKSIHNQENYTIRFNNEMVQRYYQFSTEKQERDIDRMIENMEERINE